MINSKPTTTNTVLLSLAASLQRKIDHKVGVVQEEVAGEDPQAGTVTRFSVTLGKTRVKPDLLTPVNARRLLESLHTVADNAILKASIQ